MSNMLNRNYRAIVAALAAVAIVGLSGLTLDQGHGGALPRGVIEIGELQTLAVGNRAVTVLPEVEVIGSRIVELADVDALEAGGARG